MKLSITCCLLLILLTGCSNEGTRCIDTYNQIGKEVLGDKFAEVVYTDHTEYDAGIIARYHYKGYEEDTDSLQCPYLTDDNGTLTEQFDLMSVGAALAHRSGFSSKPYLNSSGPGIYVSSYSKEGKPIVEKAMLAIMCEPKVGEADFTLVLSPPKTKKSFSEHHLQSRYGYGQSMKLKFQRIGIGELEGYAKVRNYQDEGYAYLIDLNQRFDGKNLLDFLLDEPQVSKESYDDAEMLKDIQTMETYSNAFSNNNDYFTKVTVGNGLDSQTLHFPGYDIVASLNLADCAQKGQ